MLSRTPACVGATLLLMCGCSSSDSGGGETGSAASTQQPGSSDDTTSSTGAAGDSSSSTTTPGQTASSSTTAATEGCPAQLGECIEPERYQADLEFIADLRVPGTTHWQAVQDLCADRLGELGFEVQMFDYGSGINVLGTRPGAGDGQVVLVGAHYDHIEGCLGADDNATGVAAALETARVLAMGSFEHDLVIACWDEEERGLVGSSAFVGAALDQGIEIAAYYNFEMLGYATDEPETQRVPTGFDLLFTEQTAALEANENRGDFLFVAADDLSGPALASIELYAVQYELPTLTVSLSADQKKSDLFGDLRRSDHAPFWNGDLPAMFITDTAEFRNDNYHCIGGEDTVESLTPLFTEKVMRVAVSAAADSLVRED